MKQLLIFLIMLLMASCVQSGDYDCGDDSLQPGTAFVPIDGLNLDNFPRIDGSTSTAHLRMIVACKLLDLPYLWSESWVTPEWEVRPDYDLVSVENVYKLYEKVPASQTSGAFVNLINGTTDLILTHRTLSSNERTYAEAMGVTLIETPIASDAFVFVVNPANPVKSLTLAQIQDIYTKKIRNWEEVGGGNALMGVFTRPRNSDSEEVMREMVMKDLTMADFPEAVIATMSAVFSEVTRNEYGLCYTFNNYKEVIARVSDEVVQRIAIDGVFPDDKNVVNGTYPLISHVYVAIRADVDPASTTRKLYEWLCSPAVTGSLKESAFLPLK